MKSDPDQENCLKEGEHCRGTSEEEEGSHVLDDGYDQSEDYDCCQGYKTQSHDHKH